MQHYRPRKTFLPATLWPHLTIKGGEGDIEPKANEMQDCWRCKIDIYLAVNQRTKSVGYVKQFKTSIMMRRA
jgi:hypothetical protein